MLGHDPWTQMKPECIHGMKELFITRATCSTSVHGDVQ